MYLSISLYCITPALDGYISLPDRTPCTQMMTSLNICSTVYDLWNPQPHLLMFIFFQLCCFHPDFLPSELTTCGQEHPQLIPRKLGYHPQFCNLGTTCVTYHCGGNVENAV